MTRARRHEIALALIERMGVPRAVAVAPQAKPGRVFPMDAQRLTITSPVAGSTKFQSVHMPARGRLSGIEVFVDTPGSGDTITVRLNNRTIIDRWFVDLAVKTSYEKDLDEPAVPGDILTLSYLSADGTSKTVTWTPSLESS